MTKIQAWLWLTGVTVALVFSLYRSHTRGQGEWLEAVICLVVIVLILGVIFLTVTALGVLLA